MISNETRQKRTMRLFDWRPVILFLGMGIFWIIILSLFPGKISEAAFLLCLFLGTLLLVEQGDYKLDRFIFIRGFDEDMIKDIKKEKTTMGYWSCLVGMSYILLGLTCLSMPIWLINRLGRFLNTI